MTDLTAERSEDQKPSFQEVMRHVWVTKLVIFYTQS